VGALWGVSLLRSWGVSLTVSSILPIEIRMEPDANHKKPHLHINYGKMKHVASYGILDGERIVGDLNKKYDQKVKDWIIKDKEKLIVIWDDMQKGNQSGYELHILGLDQDD
jgi:hypothetical protein